MPILFIAAGVVLLLNTLQVLDWGIWQDIAKLWPIAVILFGLNLLWVQFRRM